MVQKPLIFADGELAVFLALVEDPQQAFQLALSAVVEVRDLHDDAVVGEALDEFLPAGDLLFA